MPLTPQEQRTVDAAKLDQLIASLMEALRGGNAAAKEAALIALADFRTATLDDQLADRAGAARVAGSSKIIADALEKRAQVAKSLAPLGEVFADAARIGASGKKELLFPRLAASASTMLEMVQQLQATADKVKQGLANVNELGDVPDALNTVQSALETLKQRAKAKQA